MNLEKLIAQLKIWNCEQKDLNTILSFFKYQRIKKNRYFLEKGKLCDYIGFVETGMFQHYSLVDGDIKTTNISSENDFITSYLSFVLDEMSQESIKALTDATVFLMSKTNLKKLADEIPKFKDFYIQLLENTVCHYNTSHNNLLTLSGKERYQKIIKEHPKILKEIPLQYLANMIGLTPRHLSRIRKDLT